MGCFICLHESHSHHVVERMIRPGSRTPKLVYHMSLVLLSLITNTLSLFLPLTFPLSLLIDPVHVSLSPSISVVLIHSSIDPRDAPVSPPHHNRPLLWQKSFLLVKFYITWSFTQLFLLLTTTTVLPTSISFEIDIFVVGTRDLLYKHFDFPLLKISSILLQFCQTWQKQCFTNIIDVFLERNE